MSKKASEKQFWDMMKAFIDLANEYGNKKVDPNLIDGALLYAATRFNIHNVARQTEDLNAEKEPALEYYSEKYKEMFNENFELILQQANKK